MNGLYFQQSTPDLLTTYRALIIEAMTPNRTVEAVNETQVYLQAIMLELDAQGVDFSGEYLKVTTEFGWQ